MKKYLHSVLLKVHATVFSILFLSAESLAALHGTYTINPAAPASATNYKDWTSALSDLKDGTRSDGGVVNGPGVSAAVLFNVSAGTYIGFIEIPFVDGVSSVNTISFDGGDADGTILQVNSSSSSYLSAVTLNSCRYVTLKNFTIDVAVDAANDNCSGVSFTGAISKPCTDNQLLNCNIQLPVVPYVSYSFTPNSNGIIMSGSVNKPDIVGYFKNNLIEGCTISKGFWGIYTVGKTDSCSGNIFRNNRILNYASVGMYLSDMSAVKVLNNFLYSDNESTTFSYGYWYWVNMGIIISDCPSGSNAISEISGNQIKSFWQGGMYLINFSGTSSFPTLVSNNIISNGGIVSTAYETSGLQISYSNFCRIWNNSIDINQPTQMVTNAAFYDDGSSQSIDVRNNIFSYSAAGGKGLPFWGNRSSRYSAFDYNLFYNADTAKYGIIDNTLFTTPQVGGGTLNLNSVATNPNFKSTDDLHLINYTYGAHGTSLLPTDIDGESRGNPPLIGADDFPSPADNDLNLIAVTSPPLPAPAGLQTVTVKIMNTGTNTVTAAKVSYSLNGTVVTESWSGSLAQGASADFTFSTKANLVAGRNEFKVFTSSPNNTVDSYTGNDTIEFPLYTTLSGIYTLNRSLAASATNFISFHAAADALNGGTVTGAVTINIAPGIYNEQVELKTTKGTSAVNTVKFNGQDTSKVVLTWNGSYGNQHTLKLSGCTYVTFSGIKITSTNNKTAWAVHFATDRTDYNRITKCALSVPAITDDLNNCPVLFGGSVAYLQPYSVPYVSVKYNQIDSCVIKGGKIGIAFMGGTLSGSDTLNTIGNKFMYNHIVRNCSWGILANQANGSKILNNVITPDTSIAGGICVSSTRSSYNDFTDISGNIITRFGFNLSSSIAMVQAGLYLVACNGGKAGNFRVANNMIGSLLTSSSCMNMNSCRNIDVLYNTFNYTQEGTTSPGFAALSSFSPGPNTYRNNIFAVTAALGKAACFYEANDTSKLTAAGFDYNIFYNKSNNNTAFFGGKLYTPSTVVGGSGMNMHSHVTDPQFKAIDDMHIAAQSNLGIAIPGITTDFDGQARSTIPCIGADEINIGCTSPANPGIITGDSIVCHGEKNIIYSIPNIPSASGYEWSVPKGVTVISGSSNNSITVDFTNSAEDGYIIVKGVNACGSGTMSLPYPVTVHAIPVVSFTSKETRCFESCDGLLLTEVSGSGNYAYIWNTGAIGEEISGLCKGNYSVTVTDLFGCSSESSAQVISPSELAIHPTVQDATCETCKNGSITLSVSGGISPYTYSWENGATTPAVSGIGTGAYNVCVTDANGCAKCETITLTGTTGIANASPIDAVRIFPNPGAGYFNIITKDDLPVRAEVYSVTGKKVYDNFFSGNSFTLDLSSNAKAVYILQLTSGKQVIQKKIIIQ